MNTIEQLWGTIFSLNDPVGLTVNLVILTLFIIAVIDVGLSRRRLKRERKLIKEAGGQLQSRQHCPDGPVEAVLDFLLVPLDSLLGRRIARVIRLRSKGLGHREVLQQLTGERIEGYGALARYIGLILTLLGLLGTVFGLAIALASIQGTLAEVNDVAALKKLTEALGGTLRGMKTAFGCTIMGIFTAIILSYLNHTVRRLQSSVVAALEEFVICELLPVLESVDPKAEGTAKAFANALSGAATDLDQLRQTITTAATDYKRASEQMETAAGTLQTAVQSFDQRAVQIADSQQTFTQTMGETRDAVKAMTEIITRQFADVREFTTTSNKLLEARLAAIEESTKANLALQESLKTLAENFRPAIIGYHDLFQEVVGKLFAEFQEALNHTLSNVNQQHREGIVGQLSQNQKAIEGMLTQYTDRLQNIAEQNRQGLADLVGEQGAVLRAFSEQNRQGLSELIGQQNTALRAFSDMVVDVNLNLGTVFGQLGVGNDGYPRPARAVTAGGQ